MMLVDLDLFNPIFLPFVGKKIGYVRMDGNVGDDLIEHATIELFQYFNIAFRVIEQKELSESALKAPVDELAIAGGGNMGDYYKPPIAARTLAAKLCKPITILPQTFTNQNENLGFYSRIFVRENTSKAQIQNSILAPDLALGYSYPRLNQPTANLGLFLRVDSEGLFSDNPQSDGDPTLKARSVGEYLNLAARYQHVVTDRLHFAIASLGFGRRTTLLPNSYFKNRAMYETWLESLGCEWANRPEDVY